MNDPTTPSVFALAKMIDHSLLHPTLSDAQLDTGCALAARFEAASACVKPCHVPRAAKSLAGTGTLVCSVIGFPHGNSHTSIKVQETLLAIAEGAKEIDMVVNLGDVLGGNFVAVTSEVRAINDACLAGGAILKVIFENDYLDDRQIIELCRACTAVGVAFVKTSTGYGFVKQPSGDYNYRGATDRHLALMRTNCPPAIQIKAAGGVRTLDDLLRVRALGVTRIGATATEAILRDALARGFPPGSAKLAILRESAVGAGVARPAEGSPPAGY